MILDKLVKFPSILELSKNDNILRPHGGLFREYISAINDSFGNRFDINMMHPKRLLNILNFILILLVISILFDISMINDLRLKLISLLKILNGSKGLTIRNNNKIIVITNKIRSEFILTIF